MTRYTRKLACIQIVFVTVLSLGASHAQDSKPNVGPTPPAATSPPIALGGFKYDVLPNGAHMFRCEKASDCGAGSKLSYVVVAKEPKVSFADYKASRQRLAVALKAQAPAPGLVFTFQEPVDKSDKVFTLFESRREEADTIKTTKVHTISTFLVGPTIGFDVISSATEMGVAEANLNKFLLVAMLMAGIDGKDPKANKQ